MKKIKRIINWKARTSFKTGLRKTIKSIDDLKNKSPKVSIVMNCHNGEKYLNKSLTSVISQSYKNWELIFWNNKSTDKSEKIFKSFRDPRFKYFKSNYYQKLYKARNSAHKKMQRKYIAFIDTDDWWLKKFKNKLIY